MNNSLLQKIKQEALDDHIPIIMDETLKIMEDFLIELKPKNILEIGTATGYSAICFSKYLQKDGFIDTIERDEERIKKAKQNIEIMKLQNKINIYEGDAIEILPKLKKIMIWCL